MYIYYNRISNEELQDDPGVQAMLEETEESKKVARNGGRKHFAVFRRIDDSDLRKPDMLSLFSE